MDFEEDPKKLYCSECSVTIHEECFRLMPVCNVDAQKCPQCRREIISPSIVPKKIVTPRNALSPGRVRNVADPENIVVTHNEMIENGITFTAYIRYRFNLEEAEDFEVFTDESNNRVMFFYEWRYTRMLLDRFDQLHPGVTTNIRNYSNRRQRIQYIGNNYIVMTVHLERRSNNRYRGRINFTTTNTV